MQCHSGVRGGDGFVKLPWGVVGGLDQGRGAEVLRVADGVSCKVRDWPGSWESNCGRGRSSNWGLATVTWTKGERRAVQADPGGGLRLLAYRFAFSPGLGSEGLAPD